MNGAIELVILGLAIGFFDVGHDAFEDITPQVGRGRHAQERKQRLEQAVRRS